MHPLIACALLGFAASLVPAARAASPHPASATKSAAAKAARPASPAKIPPLLSEVEQAYAKAGTLAVDFSQTERIASMDRTKTSSGRILVKKPNKVRWEIQKPDQSLLVSDGRTFWFYTPPFDEGERGQVIVRQASQVKSKLADALLSGNFRNLKDMKIESKGKATFVLKPRRNAAGDVKRAEVVVDPAKKHIEKVVLDFVGGNRTEIALTNVQLGVDAPDDRFRFEVPPNTDVLKE
jgi:outer membrane lipoprotein carrier protein